jgi:hypothetical protein
MTTEETKDLEVIETEQALKVRPLNALDVLTLAKILAKVGKDAREALKAVNDSFNPQVSAAKKIRLEAEAQTYETEEAKAAAIKKAELEEQAALESINGQRGQEIALTVLTLALENAEDYLTAFLADLVGKKKEEFKTLSFSAPIEIIHQLAQSPDFTDFFEKARGLAKIFMK